MFKPFGKYTILKKIASGGMAEIFLATDLSPAGLTRFIVIKKALAKYSDNKEFRDMFKNEGKIACNLKHRNIAPIYEFGIENNQFYLAMEYISGVNLRELIKKLRSLKKPVDIRYAVYIIKEAASGLNYAHNAIESSTGQPLNLIHRDISPQNIMLSFDGEIRIIDFGISKVADTDLTRAGHLKGKFSYMSPEQARGEAVDGRTDVFCLGIILWELLSGQRLFSGKNEIDALKKIKSCHIPDIKEINPKIPSQLADIVNQTLNKNKNLRTKTASILEKNLSIFLNKNYPEFSQYDFMSFVNKTYSKEILEEREQLKSYYKEFKSYINKLNTENNFQIKLESDMINRHLDIPNIDSHQNKVEIEKETVTKTQKSIGGLSDYVSFSRSQTEEQTRSSTFDKKSNTFLLKGKHYDTSSSIKKDTSVATKELKEPRDKTPDALHDTKTNLDFQIIKDGNKSLSAYSKTMNFKTDSLKNLPQHMKTNTNLSQIDNQERAVNLIKNIVAFGLILLIGFGGYYAFQNKEKIVSSKKWDKLFKEKTTSEQSQRIRKKKYPSETSRSISNTFIKKVWIQTTPSGATIYINKKAIANTPVSLDIDLTHLSELIIHKQGYLSYSLQKKQVDQLNNSLFITLQKNTKRRRRSKNITIIK